ncbi:PAP1-domain-containing protein [Suhomyces tanzawaensis NRRL Y-17324]|uniref:PAP1-domain-containing protein n=1 Tax=Suhomyces tanzawaensis NRRL Y-17324 TaxID=984487 RepID=A0A1E4SG53_9ASCO|nr:PAP1-domain-containing protein [Suhomyces tanzawaensis NRRL Y-17324]ODV78487.1 PAP1-domain-containing protein [Suhomyces tanzawaensis NRRL Y-17324]
MTDIKRNISDVTVDLPSSGSFSPESHNDKKLHTKPGRKPIETEPKSKRTAQNRAAQRAYRERKERKMKDLEDKVKSLEEDNIKALTESDFLKAQVDMLKSELARYRGNADMTDLNLPNKVGKLTHPQTGGYLPSFSSQTSVSTKSSSLSNHIPSVSSVGSEPATKLNTSPFSVDFPWSKDNLKKNTTTDSISSHNSSNNNFQVPDLVGGSSSSSSPLNENILVSPDSSVSSTHESTNLQIKPTTKNSISNNFEEKVDPFCVQLNEACGTKQCPIPKYKRNGSKASVTSSTKYGKDDQFQQYNSPFSNLVTPNSNFEGYQGGQVSSQFDYLSDPFFLPNNNTNTTEFNFPESSNDDPLAFLNDNNFDVSLAFGNSNTKNEVKKPEVKEVDPISFLTTEESIYDPLNQGNNFDLGDFVKPAENISQGKYDSAYTTSVVPNDEEDENEVVPAPADTMRCSEIWDRITAHPKYTEIDIDGLCSELKSKAKCSERGVVINSADVNQLLEQSTMFKR